MRRTLSRLVRLGRFIRISVSRRLVIGDTRYRVAALRINPLAKAAAARDYEQSADEVLRAVFKLKPGAFIDVGANVGQTLIKVLRIDKDRQYVGFEPQAAGCSFIHQFIRSNRLANHLILPIGLGREDGIVRLGLREENDVTASMVEEYRPEGFYSYYQPIPISRGDAVLERLGVEALSLIKIDVEGGELDVLHGLKESLAKSRPFLLFELLPNYLLVPKKELDDKVIAYRDERHKEMGLLLKAWNYTVFQIRPGEGLRPIEELTADRKILFNCVGVPNEAVPDFEKAYEGRIT